MRERVIYLGPFSRVLCHFDQERLKLYWKCRVFFVWAISICVPITCVLAQAGPANVVVSEALLVPVAATQAFMANVNANRRVIVGSAVDGRVEKYLIHAGQVVKAEEPLAELRTKTIEIELAGAQAELQLFQAELKEMLAGSRAAEIKLAEAQLEAVHASRKHAQARFKRAELMMKTQAGMSQEEYDEARSLADRSEAQVREAESHLALVKEGPRAEKIEQARARVEAQSQVVAGLDDRLKKYTTRAPFDGFVVRELTQIGAWVKQADPIAEIVEIDPVEVEVYVPEKAVRFVRPGLKCTINVEAMPGRTFVGEVSFIVPMADARARTFPVRVHLANPIENLRHVLMPGMQAQVSLPVDVEQTRLLVPKDALTLNRGQATIAKVVGSSAQLVPVRPGVSLDGLIEVIPLSDAATLQPGDQVVVRGNERLRFVNPQEPPQVTISQKLDAKSFLLSK